MKCGYCDKEITIDENHYCIEGRNFIVDENNRLREVKAQRDKLLAALDWVFEIQKRNYGNATNLHIDMLDFPVMYKEIKEVSDA